MTSDVLARGGGTTGTGTGGTGATGTGTGFGAAFAPRVAFLGGAALRFDPGFGLAAALGLAVALVFAADFRFADGFGRAAAAFVREVAGFFVAAALRADRVRFLAGIRDTVRGSAAETTWGAAVSPT
jgi:hypothetical protein